MGSNERAAKTKQPNIWVILVDELGRGYELGIVETISADFMNQIQPDTFRSGSYGRVMA